MMPRNTGIDQNDDIALSFRNLIMDEVEDEFFRLGGISWGKRI